MTQETKKRIAKIEELGRSDPISVYRESLVTEPPVIGERARSPYQFVNVYAKEPKPRPKFADILETMRSKATCIDDPKYKSEVNGQKSQPPTQRNTDQSNGTSENIPSNSAVNPAALDELDNLNSESSFSYDDDVGDSELLTRIREAFTDNSEPIPTVPKTPERRRRSSSLAPNTPSPAKRNIEDEEPDPGQSSFTTSKEEDLAAMFLENPWFAFKKRNPKQVFLCNYDAECVPFKVVKGGKVLGEWVFALDMVYRKDALHQLLMATSLHANDPGNRMMETILQKFDREPEVVYKKKFVSRDGALRFTVKELWCDDEWKFNLEARVNFPRLLRMMETSRRVELESDSWLDWLDCSEKN
ncbi:uncharacterized protein EV420DRAFT_1555292 [Desarmillaria tabescens]|uniref:Uncharacterized protein n=1 Tax=Armillaria tabescens TaxID=1929756 RepID=A0AA39K6S2_ARMTA|nr:uncharacterized protein EV420DRAFT_1555292 [Desarmillaria tabescens]KAK0455333.1 hypothetical protein EV420DRAFT_1555292 [Desarmillaria tabescens]